MRFLTIIKSLMMSMIVFIGLQSVAVADILVITHADNTNDITPKFVKNLYQGKLNRFDDGSTAIPLLLSEDNQLTSVFLEEVVEQKPVQFKRLWSRALFTGNGTPPEHIATEQEMINKVMSDPRYIGIIHRDNFTNDVRAVIRIRLETE